MCDLVNKMEGGDDLNYEWKKKGLKIQFQTADRALKKCRLASVAMKAKQVEKAQEFLEGGMNILTETHQTLTHS